MIVQARTLSLRCCLSLLLGLASCAAQAAERPAQSPGQPSVGQALAADLTWPQPLRDQRFGHMDQVFPVHVVHRGRAVHPLRAGKPLPVPDAVIDDYISRQHLAGLLVLEEGRIRLERYALGDDATTHWTGFSMTKSATDTLVGVALHRGTIQSLEDSITRYLPELKGSAYDGVTVRELMTMTSGVRWHENYTTQDADNVRLYTSAAPAGENSTVAYMRTLTRTAAAGSVWNYNTGETDLLGVLLCRATGHTLAEQLSSALWQHAGMESDATWIATASARDGQEFGGSGLSATLRDWARFGQWMLEGGHGALDKDWIAEATRAQVQAGQSVYGYGWWPQKNASGSFDGSYAALGIFGQSMLISPSRRLVLVTLGDWSEATGPTHTAARARFWQQVEAALDAERR